MYHGVFSALRFPKTGEDIVKQSMDKKERMEQRVKEREEEIASLAKEMGLGSAVDVLIHADELDDRMSNSAGASGDKAKLRNALGKVRREREEIKQLALVIENLPRNQSFDLEFDALEYFGF